MKSGEGSSYFMNIYLVDIFIVSDLLGLFYRIGILRF